MSFNPQQVNKMSLWEMNACIAGHVKANGGEVSESLSDDEFSALGDFIDRA